MNTSSPAIATLPSPQNHNIPSIKLAISVCCNRPMLARPAMGFAMMIHCLTAAGIPFSIISRMQASVLPQSRQDCLNEALADECTHQLWWDDDIEPPHDAPLRMLQAMHNNPEIDVLAANYCRKQDSLMYTAEDLNYKMIESFGKIGVEEADKVGMGLMMVKMEKLRAIPAPHFEVTWMPQYNKYIGEDRYFTRKIREHGMRIFVDHGISNFTQHWGDLGYNFRMFQPRQPMQYPKMPDAMTDEQHSREHDGHGE